MAKTPNLTDVGNILTSATTINTNNEEIIEAFQNTLSRDGSTPNQMLVDLDLNSNDLINVKNISVVSLEVGGVTFTPNNVLTVPDWEGVWTTAEVYALNDIVQTAGASYICVEAHTAGTFSTDLAAGKWELFAARGATGAGTGDLLSANNLSDLSNSDTALANLGAGTGGISVFKNVGALGVDNVTGFVGVGTTSPTRALHIYNDSAMVFFEDAGDNTKSIIEHKAGGQLEIKADISENGGSPEIQFIVSGVSVGQMYDTGWAPTSFTDVNGGFLDEDTLVSDSATAVPSQQSVKAYADNNFMRVKPNAVWNGVSLSSGQVWTNQFDYWVQVYVSGDGTNSTNQIVQYNDGVTWTTIGDHGQADIQSGYNGNSTFWLAPGHSFRYVTSSATVRIFY